MRMYNVNYRLAKALEWCKKHNIERTEQLSLFAKLKKRKKKKEGIDRKEFKEMCQKAGVKPESLCKTIFTESIK